MQSVERIFFLPLLKSLAAFGLLCLFGGHPACCQSKPVFFQRIIPQEGQRIGSVGSIVKDQDGMLYLGSNAGFKRFDGYQLKRYMPIEGKSSSIASVNVHNLLADNAGLIWVNAGRIVSRFNPKTDTFLRIPFKGKGVDVGRLGYTRLILGRHSNIWAVSGFGLFEFDSTEMAFVKSSIYQQFPAANQLPHKLYDCLEDSRGNLWVADYGKGLGKINLQTGEVTLFPESPGNESGPLSNVISELFEDHAGMIWIGTKQGLSRYDPETELFRDYAQIRDLNEVSIGYIIEDQQKTLWMTSYYHGIIRLDKGRRHFEVYQHNPGNSQSIANNAMMAIYEDDKNVLWFGGLGGLQRYDPKRAQFRYYCQDINKKETFSGTSFYAFLEDEDGRLWLGTHGQGLDVFDPKSEEIIKYKNEPDKENSIGNDVVLALFDDRRGNMWIGTGTGLDVLNRQTGNFRHLQISEKRKQGIIGKNVRQICRDDAGGMWFGTSTDGISYLASEDRQLGHFVNYSTSNSEICGDNVFAIFAETPDSIWIGTTQGLSLFQPSLNKFSKFLLDDSPENVQRNFFSAITKGPKGNYWLGTVNSGLVKMTVSKGDGTVQFLKQSPLKWLPQESIRGMLLHQNRYLWISQGFQGDENILRVDLHTEEVIDFDQSFGINVGMFQEGGVFRGASGNFYFGGTDGFISFNPDSVQVLNSKPQIKVTGFSVIGDSLHHPSTISLTEEINLSYEQRFFEIQFSILDFATTYKNSYQYQLEGLDKDWVEGGGRPFTRYTDVDPGQYIFRVKGANRDGVWSDPVSLAIVVASPWWRAPWAYAFYLLLGLGGLYFWRRYDLKRVKLGNELKLKAIENKKLQEVDRLKSNFLMNISHEFRTPLTLIEGPVDQLLNEEADSQNQRFLRVIRKNAQRLRSLIDQLLTLAKSDSQQLKLNARKTDVCRILKFLAANFESRAAAQGIDYQVDCGIKSLDIFLDPEKFEQVILNLLDNAFKYTPDQGRITVSLNHQDSKVEIAVSNSGPGIPQEHLPHIFERFYRVSWQEDIPGSGIGLALAKDLITLHHGTISVQSQAGDATTFTISLLTGKDHLKPEEIVDVSQTDSERWRSVDGAILEQSEPAEDKPPLSSDLNPNIPQSRLLIVEDNQDLQDYMRNLLEDQYRILQAFDGQKGLQMANSETVDLVLCDVMMPKMSGDQLCQQLKSEVRTSHLPVIMLTARASERGRLKGLAMGADAYLTKPFNAAELRLTISNTLATLEAQQQLIRTELLTSPQPFQAASIDEIFLQKALSVVEANIDQAEFDTEKFAGEMFLSRMHLHRKLRALCGQTPREFIRTIRLKRAHQLISQKSGTVTEIAYAVGFNNPSYFSKCFRDIFGVLPSEMISVK